LIDYLARTSGAAAAEYLRQRKGERMMQQKKSELVINRQQRCVRTHTD
jgi:hypothetical protein